jgi:F-type H+-transporting ATPase subunit gamma
MKLVSAAKVRRAQEAMTSGRPYAESLEQVAANLAKRANPDDHPMLKPREEKVALYLIVCSDRGLCGAFNSNLFRQVTSHIADREGEQIVLGVIGKKGRDYFRYRKFEILKTYLNLYKGLTIESVRPAAEFAIDYFLKETSTVVYLAFNRFRSIINQKPEIVRLLPAVPAPREEREAVSEHLYEPTTEEVLDGVLREYVTAQLYRAMLESQAGEHAARMTAMDSATKNAGEMIAGLTLTFNRQRQQKITKELIEVVSGADALKE